jgi:hypothetical protein
MAGALKGLESNILAFSYIRTSGTAVVLGNICAVSRHFEVPALLLQEIQMKVIFLGFHCTAINPLTLNNL